MGEKFREKDFHCDVTHGGAGRGARDRACAERSPAARRAGYGVERGTVPSLAASPETRQESSSPDAKAPRCQTTQPATVISDKTI